MADVYNHSLVKVEKNEFSIADSTIKSYTLRLNAPILNGGMNHAGTIVAVHFLGEGASTGTITPSASSVNEGSTLQFTVGLTRIGLGVPITWRVNIISGLAISDFVAVKGSITRSSGISGNFTVTLQRNKKTASVAQTFTVTLLKGSDELATSQPITVVDVSQTPQFSISMPSQVNETTTTQVSTARVNIQEIVSPGDSVEATQVLSWSVISNGNYAVEENYSPTSGTVVLTNGSGFFDITILADNKTSPNKSFNIKLGNIDGTSVIQNTNPTCNVVDTSQESWATTINLTGIPSNIATTYTDASQTAEAYIVFYTNGEVLIFGGQYTSTTWSSTLLPSVGPNYAIEFIYTKSGGDQDNTPYGTFVQFPDGYSTYTAASTGPRLQLNEPRQIYLRANNYACSDPSTPILVNRDGTTKLAGELVVGDLLYTIHEITGNWGYYPVTQAEVVTQPKALVTFDDDSTLHVSLSHMFYLGRNIWKNLFNLTTGIDVATCISGVTRTIVSIEPTGPGPVVSLEVENAHTYIANNIISHNNKQLIDSSGQYNASAKYSVVANIYRISDGSLQVTAGFNISAKVSQYIPQLNYTNYWDGYSNSMIP
jgi:hypothetical protein